MYYKYIESAETDDGKTIAVHGKNTYVIESVEFDNQRVGDKRIVYTCFDNYLLKLSCRIIDIVFLSNGKCEIVSAVMKRGNRKVSL